jgi:linoleoyl-CoA desaturase
MIRKAISILAWFLLSYGLLLATSTLATSILAAGALAFAACALGFGVFHDANHGTLFASRTANQRAARLCSVILGPSRHFWLHKHHTLHHRQPNVFAWDDDIDARGLLRLTPECPWAPRFRGQELRALLFYGLNTIEWFFWKDFRCLMRGRLNEWQPLNLAPAERAELLACKGLYFGLFVLPPFIVLPIASSCAAFLIFHLVFSWVLTAVFQLAHLTPAMEFGGVREGDDWAMHQMRTTADFATRSSFITWFTGGLNHQVEHHLFPTVAHTHYAALRPIVCSAARQHGLPCHDLGTVRDALIQHFALLRDLGSGSLKAEATAVGQ